ncbi:MAG: tandem-95 repeat protein, partial [Verrucomicrobia bacterium]|nr:tandem-95 repeat protein [Verrucomicrobiota bacterium]
NITSTGTPQFPYMSNIWYFGTPTGSTVTTISENVTNQFTGGANRPLTIDTPVVASPNVTLTWNAVEGGTYSVDASANNSTWSSKATGLTVSNANTKSNTHATLGTTGTEYARVNRTALATYDATGTVAATVAQTTSTSFNLGSTATAPTLTTISTLSGANEDAPSTLSYATLLAASNAADANGDAISFRIESVTSGTLTLSGANVAPGTSLVTSADSLVWTPAENANGTLAAFTVKAWDGALASATAVQVNVSISAVNDAPTLSVISNLADGVEDTAMSITYAMVAAAANEADVDGTALSFRVAETFSGTLTKNGVAVAIGTLLSAGDTMLWTPPGNGNGMLTAMDVVASDGALESGTALGVQAYIAPVNDAPIINDLADASGTEDIALTISHAAFAVLANEFDVDGDAISFRIESVSSGTLTKNGSAITPGSTLLSSGESIVWTPPTDVNGHISAFTIKAWDGELASDATHTLFVNLTAVNDAPTLTSISTLTGATEDEPFGIHVATLETAANEADAESGVSFRIESVTSGTLTKGGIAVTPGTTLISEGESVAWTPAANANGTLAAFTVKAWDGEYASATAVQVNVSVAPV